MRSAFFIVLVGITSASPARSGDAAPSPSAACVEGGEKRKHARILYREATAGPVEVRNEKLGEALMELERSAALCPAPAVFSTRAVIQAELGQNREAIDSLSRFLEAGTDPEGRAETLILKLAGDLKVGLVSIEAPSGARLLLDGHDLGPAPLELPLQLPAGRHELEVQAMDSKPFVQVYDVEPGTRSSWSVQPPAPSAPRASTPPATPAPSPVSTAPLHSKQSPADSHLKSTLGWVTAGVGVVIGCVALAHHVWNRERYATWKSEDRAIRTNHSAGDYSRRQIANNELANSVNDASRFTVALGLAGGVLVATGGTLVIVGRVGATDTQHASSAFMNFEGTW